MSTIEFNGSSHAKEMCGKEFIGKAISYLYRYEQIFIGKKIEPYGIGSGQFPFLMRLYREDGINQESLSDYLKIDKGTTARAIQKLVDEGYVFRQRDEKDRRSYRVFLTEKGKKLEPDMKRIASEWEDILFSGFDDSQRKNITNSLGIMFENVLKIM
ncbi:Transcriptional regulator, MarR family [Methanosarcina horonobensis HB-1 = JCM 15518]|uniref:Transcriptional regulator, MarR family n=1 Tax=Methanosarcina horonobensis HB-1 = JCM 15518 TaxID=1434110 RepID=A0A0E3WVG2_9EURY|nr:Transcriptional regulator, MarR family [Methanosarcina horonobensis HB-1 = JCM 15518]